MKLLDLLREGEGGKEERREGAKRRKITDAHSRFASLPSFGLPMWSRAFLTLMSSNHVASGSPDGCEDGDER
jgi:hypothetical protein